VTRVAVVGHVEWVEFLRLERFPEPDAVTAADDAFLRAGGGGVVAAVALAELGVEVDFFCALGRDDNGRAAERELQERGIRVHAAWRETATRRVITLLVRGGERTIITLGERLAPNGDDPLEWDRLESAEGVYFTAGDAAAAEQARRGRQLVTTPRAREALAGGQVKVDALIYSTSDRDEAHWAEVLAEHARLLVATEGAEGGHWWGTSEGRWPAAEAPGEPQDDYGCGDSFAAGVTLGLAEGEPIEEAVRIGAERGAWALTRVGAP
jgi:ribokinase